MLLLEKMVKLLKSKFKITQISSFLTELINKTRVAFLRHNVDL